MPDAEEKAREITSRAKTVSTEATAKIASGASHLSIHEFFPELQDPRYAFRTNLPRGVAPPQFSLLGRQAIFDLEPLSSQEFIKQHRIDIRTALDLVERAILIPNLYFRDPTSWRGFDHMHDLVALSVNNGERVDSFMRLKSPSYDEDSRRHRDDLKAAFAPLTPDQRQALALIARVKPHEKLEQVCATRWAYLDGFKPSTSELAQDYCNKRLLRELVTYIRIAKHNVASETTAAIGGHFVWGGDDIALCEELESPPEGGLTFDISEEVEYLLTEIVRIRPLQPLHDVDSKALLAFLDASDNVQARNQVFDTIDDLVELAEAKQLSEAKVHDYKGIVDDYRKRLSAAQLGAAYALEGAVGVAGAGVGLIFSGAWGALFGGALGVWAGKAAGAAAKPLGRLAFRLSATNRRAEKVISTLDVFKQSASV
jgi:hypothetical protein